MSTRVGLSDTDITQVRGLIGSGDRTALERAAEEFTSEFVIRALERIVIDGAYDATDHNHQEAASLLSALFSDGHYGNFGDTQIWAYAELADWLATTDERAAELVRHISVGRNVVTGAPADTEDPYAYLTHAEVLELREALTGLQDPGELIGGELQPLLVELAAARKDLVSYAS